MSIEWNCISGPHGDETSQYIGKINNQIIIKDFIENELKENEWGKIYINNQYVCKYKNKIIYDVKNNLLKQYQKNIIQNISAYGGWTLMDYYLDIEELNEIENTNIKNNFIYQDGYNF